MVAGELNLLTEIDDYTWKQAAWVLSVRHEAYDAGPGYMRLGHAQRVALAQDLERAILAHPEPDKPYPVPKANNEVTPDPDMGYAV